MTSRVHAPFMRRRIHLMMALVLAGCASERASLTARTLAGREIAADVAGEGSARRAHEALARGRAFRDELRFSEALAAFDEACRADPANEDARRERERTALVLEPADPALAARLHEALERGGDGERIVPEVDLATVRWLIENRRRDEALARVERLREWLRWMDSDREMRARADELYLEAKKTPEPTPAGDLRTHCAFPGPEVFERLADEAEALEERGRAAEARAVAGRALEGLRWAPYDAEPVDEARLRAVLERAR
jgi:hypothetical protein